MQYNQQCEKLDLYFLQERLQKLDLELLQLVKSVFYSFFNNDCITITGTNGKTTVSWLIHQGFKKIGYKSGYIGTLGYGLENLNLNELTTPSCMKLHKILSEFQNSGVEYVVMEISSHAIDQRRIEGINFNSVIFTNLSRDHIDYHGNMENYGETKAKLFLERQSKIKIININNEALGMVKQWQDMNYGGRHSQSTYQNSLPDFVKLTEAYGHVGIKIEKNSELQTKLEEAFSIKDKLVFVDVYVDPNEHVYPMLVAGESLKDMWLKKDKKT